MSTHTGTCRRCQRELHGAIEMSFISTACTVCITSFETPDCNWIRCPACRETVCEFCFFFSRSLCVICVVKRCRSVLASLAKGRSPDIDSAPASRRCESCDRAFMPIGEEGLCPECIDELFENERSEPRTTGATHRGLTDSQGGVK